jgi:hypothetical protein
MQQTTLDLDDTQDRPPQPEMTPQRQRRLIALMAEVVIQVWQRQQETNNDER